MATTTVFCETCFQRAVRGWRAAQEIADGGIRFTPATQTEYYDALGAVPPHVYGRDGSFVMARLPGIRAPL